jgi:hypothetical protein
MGSEPLSTISDAALAPIGPSVTIPLFRLYLLRAGYLLLVVGLGLTVWPAVVTRVPWAPSLCGWNGIGDSLLAALALLSVLGLRYPLKMLPLLLFEITWKVIWLGTVALPTVLAHAPVGDGMAQTINACLMAVVFPLLVPWRYVAATYVMAPGDRWR